MTVFYLSVIIVCLALSAYFSASEISFNSANKLRLKRAAEGGSKPAVVAYRISENFTRSLSAILIGNNLANIAISTCATLLFIGWMKGNEGTASVVATVAVTVAVLIFGEIGPKNLGKKFADKFVLITAIPIWVLTVVLMPIVAIVMVIVKGLAFLWGCDRAEDDPTVTEEELSTIIDTIEEEGVIDEDQGELMQSALEFHDITVEKIMTPRIDVTAFDIDDDPEKIRALVSDSTQYSRVPVYEDSVDNVIGILSLTRYYKALVGKEEAPDIRELLLPPCKIHKTMKLPAALTRMRERKMHLAIVIDEFGGTLGVVTMEDILEELVGDIWDDTDVIVTQCYATGQNTFTVSGDMNIDDCFEEIGFGRPENFTCEYTTMGGWAIEMLEANPHVGDSFNYQNLFVVVAGMDEERVTELTVLVTPMEEEETE